MKVYAEAFCGNILWLPLTILPKYFILDVWQVSEHGSVMVSARNVGSRKLIAKKFLESCASRKSTMLRKS